MCTLVIEWMDVFLCSYQIVNIHSIGRREITDLLRTSYISHKSVAFTQVNTD